MAARKGLSTDIFQLLMNDHADLEDFFEQIEKADNTARQQMLKEMEEVFFSHLQMEERHFYPAVAGVELVADAAAEALSEHEELRGMFHDMEELQVDSDEWDEKIGQLREAAENHFALEEGEIYSEIRETMRQDELVRLGQQVASEKEEKQTLR